MLCGMGGDVKSYFNWGGRKKQELVTNMLGEFAGSCSLNVAKQMESTCASWWMEAWSVHIHVCMYSIFMLHSCLKTSRGRLTLLPWTFTNGETSPPNKRRPARANIASRCYLWCESNSWNIKYSGCCYLNFHVSLHLGSYLFIFNQICEWSEAKCHLILTPDKVCMVHSTAGQEQRK